MPSPAVGYLLDLLDGRRFPRPAGRAANLARTERLLARLGDPQRDLPTVLIAGTKGKGSAAVMLGAMEAAAGRRIGLYTKPHLVDFRERIRINDDLVPEEDLAGLVEELRPHIEAGRSDPEGAPTYFEAAVAAALLHFRRRQVDLAIVEVGLGGRLDPTNICDPVLSVMMPISYDHTEILGRTLAAIAHEKAGIIRPGRSLVSAPQPPEAAQILRAVCAASGARLVPVGDRVQWSHGTMTPAGQQVDLRGAAFYGRIDLPLVGRHQATNAATAVAAAEELIALGFPLPPEAVRRGLRAVRWPGRVEVVRTAPPVVIDVAHNVASMQALRDALQEVWPGRRLILVFGMVATHDHTAPAAVIAPLAEVVITTRPQHVRPLPPEVLAEAVRPYAPRVEAVEDRRAAVDRALSLAGPADLVCVTGSFYLAGDARMNLGAAPQEVPAGGAKHTPLPSPREGTSPALGL